VKPFPPRYTRGFWRCPPLPDGIPADGLLTLRDGEPGKPKGRGRWWPQRIFFRFERHFVYWRHRDRDHPTCVERMHQIDRFRDDFGFS
jgi:hypothetical protein